MRNNSELEISNAAVPGPPADRAKLASFQQYRSLLFSLSYRMLGSFSDAEDILQEAFIRWQGASTEEIRLPRSFLVTIVTRLCINHLQSARVRREEYVGEWLPEPLVTTPDGDPLETLRVDETLSFAFLVLLERLTPAERAVFLLREVFDYTYSEIASLLSRSEASCRQLLRRARQHISESRPRFTASAKEQKHLLSRFLEATGRGDIEGLLELLSNDVVLRSDGGGKAIAVPNAIYGADKVARGILGGFNRLVPQNLVRRHAVVNGQPGVVSYLDGRPFSVVTLDIAEGRIRAIYLVTNPDKLSHLPNLN